MALFGGFIAWRNGDGAYTLEFVVWMALEFDDKYDRSLRINDPQRI